MKRISIILLVATLILLVPLIAVQFTTEVNWDLMDFLLAGIMLFGTGIFLEFILRNSSKGKYRVLLIVTLFLVFLLIWAELAVGLFGTPLAGN